MNTKRGAILLATILCMSASAAEPVNPWLPSTVGVHLVSTHFGPNAEKMNNSNPGIYALWANGITLGAVYNSERRQGFYAGWSTGVDVFERVRADITVGAVSGYSRGVVPMVIPSVAVRVTDKASARISFLCGQCVGSTSAVHLSVEWAF